jgi:thioredoxin-related protein
MDAFERITRGLAWPSRSRSLTRRYPLRRVVGDRPQGLGPNDAVASGGSWVVRACVTSFVLGCLLLFVSGWTFSDSSIGIKPTDDWSVEAARARRTGLPILILFARQHCGYCERLKAEVLDPRVERGELTHLTGICELDIGHGGKIRDFDGEKIRTKIFVKRYGIYATPTLLVVDSKGNPLGEPIVGFNNAEDYIPYLEDLIDVVNEGHQLTGAQAEPPASPESS